MQILIKMLMPVLGGYLKTLATQEFADWILMRIMEAVVKNTKTKYDDELLAKFKELRDK